MGPLMPEYGNDPSTGVHGLVATGWPVETEEAAPTRVPAHLAPHSAVTKLAPVRPPGPTDTMVEVVMAPELLADLHDPTLIISINYVGPDRRRTERGAPVLPGPAYGVRRNGWMRRVAQALLVAALVVPLALIADHSAPAATTVAPPSAAAATPAAATATAHGSRAFTATPRHLAKVEAAYLKAVTRATDGAGATARAAGPARSSSAVPAQSAGAAPARSALRHQAAEARLAAHQQAAEVRAAARTAAAQRRAQARADRAARISAKNGGARIPSGVYLSGSAASTTPAGT